MSYRPLVAAPPAGEACRMTEREMPPTAVPNLQSVLVDEVDTAEVAPGITRRGLPSGMVLARAFDMAPGSRWPVVDHHGADESIYVVHGELIEGEDRYPAGTYLLYRAGTSHQPSTETGVQILVFSKAAD